MPEGSEKVVVITGASEGIGASLARVLGHENHALVLVARREPELRRTAENSGNRALAVVADVTRRSEVERVRDAALKEYGHVDVWVNNVGRGVRRPVLELSDEDLDTAIAINVKSALYGMQAILPHFEERGTGHVLNVSSFLGRVPVASVRFAAYSAAKAMLGSLTASVRMDLRVRHPNVHVTLVVPGIVRTEFANNALGAPATGGAGFATAPPQTAEEVSRVIADTIKNPRAEVYTNPVHAEIAKRYLEDPVAFEEHVALSHRSSQPPRAT